MTYSITMICDFEIGMCLKNPMDDWKRVTIFLFLYLSVSLYLFVRLVSICVCLSTRTSMHPFTLLNNITVCTFIYLLQFNYFSMNNEMIHPPQGKVFATAYVGNYVGTKYAVLESNTLPGGYPQRNMTPIRIYHINLLFV